LPTELQEGFAFLREREVLFDDARKKCNKARFNYFKLASHTTPQSAAGILRFLLTEFLPISLQGDMDQKKKILANVEDEHQACLAAIDAKMACTNHLKASVPKFAFFLLFRLIILIGWAIPRNFRFRVGKIRKCIFWCWNAYFTGKQHTQIRYEDFFYLYGL